MKTMKFLKKAFIISILVMKLLVIVVTCGLLVYTAFTGKSIRSVLATYDWWILFFVFDLWLTNFVNTKPLKDKE